jgi:hypothetical protein
MLQTITAALLSLYALLSDEQKKAAEGLVNGAAGLWKGPDTGRALCLSSVSIATKGGR